MKYLYCSDEIADRIRSMAKKKGISLGKMLEDCGLNRNTMTNLKTSMPNADSLAKIADYLNCSVDCLLGRNEAFLEDFAKNQLLMKYDALNAEGKQRLLQYSDDLQASGKYVLDK